MTVIVSAAAALMTGLPHLAAWMPPPAKLTVFYRLFFYNDRAGAMAMLLALLLAIVLPGVKDILTDLADWMGENPGKVAMVAFAILALGARFIYMHHPFSMDESAPIMQAHAFAHGQMAAYYPPTLINSIIPPEFQGYFVVVDHKTGGAISVYWPGLALLETPLVRLGLGWCLNPAFGALALLMIHRLASDITEDRAAGGWAMLVALASPQFTVTAMSYYAMAGELALNLLFLWLILRSDRKSAFIAGMVGGLALIMHNPVPHLLMAFPCLLWLAWRRERWGRLASAALGYLPLGLGAGLGWWLYANSFGDGSTYMAGANHPGFVAGLISTMKKVLTLPTESMLFARWLAVWKTWIWACPGLLLTLCIARKRSLQEKLLLAAFMLTFIFFLFVPYDQGWGWGYRYIHPAWGALPVIAGVLATTSDSLRYWSGRIAFAGLLATPIFLWQTHATIKHELSYRLSTPDTGNWIVFIALDTSGGYKDDLVQNPPGNHSTRYLVSGGTEKDEALMAKFFPDAVEVQRDYRGSKWKIPQAVTEWGVQVRK